MDKKLRIAGYEFHRACMIKLEYKENAGYLGWDILAFEKDLQEDLISHTKKPLTQDNLVDIANFCNFLWNLIENRKEVTNVS